MKTVPVHNFAVDNFGKTYYSYTRFTLCIMYTDLITPPPPPPPSGGVLASCLSRLVAEQLLPHACHVRGLLYQSPAHYQACQPHLQHCWHLYQALAAAAAARNTGYVTLRQVLLLLKVL